MNPDRAYRPEFDQRVIEMGREGKWWAEMALGLGINLPEFYAMMREHWSFARAVEQADQECWDWWWNQAAAALRSDDSHRFNLAAWTAAMRFWFGPEALATGVRPLRVTDWSIRERR